MYTNIFKVITKKSVISIYEDIFLTITNQNYKDYLYNQFIIEDKTKSEIARTLGVTDGTIQTHLKRYEIRKEYSPDTNYVMHKTPSIIEKETGRKFIDVYNELAEQGLSLTDICTKLNMKSVTSVGSYLSQHKKKQELKDNPHDESNYIIQGLKGRNPATVERMFREQLGIEYKDWLKSMYIDECMSLSEIYKITGISTDSLSSRMVEYGIHKTQSQIRKEQVDKGIINYDEITRKSRKTRINNFGGSSSQELLRELLKHHLETLVNQFPNIEIVTGYNEFSILSNLEIDIPIIVINGNKLIKVAIEYDGDIWHENRKTDIEKKRLLNEKNWNLIIIEETSKSSGNLNLLEDKAKYIVNEIIKLI